MKKSIITLVSLLLFLATLLQSPLLISYADDFTEDENYQRIVHSLSPTTVYSSNILQYNNFMQAYFDNLTYNFGLNYKGSCGYVAIGMLLSYYDTYLSDDIIPEIYDVNSIGDNANIASRRNSPGVLRDIIQDPNNPENYNYVMNMTASEYHAAMQNLSNTSLHSRLIMIGSSYGYYNFNDKDNPCGANPSQLNQVFNYYLQNIAELSTSDYSLNYYSGESSGVKEYTINQIKNNRPVMLYMANGADAGHVVIAYDYYECETCTDDCEHDIVYAHFGWGADSTHVNPESLGFSNYILACTVNFNISHEHSNNYGIVGNQNGVASTSYYCYDDANLNLYHVEHLDSASYDYLSPTEHIVHCSCGDITESHSFVTDNSGTRCVECEYVSHRHGFTYRAIITNATHSCSCYSCSYNYVEPCIAGPVVNGESRCIKCNQLLRTVSIMSYKNMGNGSIR